MDEDIFLHSDFWDNYIGLDELTGDGVSFEDGGIDLGLLGRRTSSPAPYSIHSLFNMHQEVAAQSVSRRPSFSPEDMLSCVMAVNPIVFLPMPDGMTENSSATIPSPKAMAENPVVDMASPEQGRDNGTKDYENESQSLSDAEGSLQPMSSALSPVEVNTDTVQSPSEVSISPSEEVNGVEVPFSKKKNDLKKRRKRISNFTRAKVEENESQRQAEVEGPFLEKDSTKAPTGVEKEDELPVTNKRTNRKHRDQRSSSSPNRPRKKKRNPPTLSPVRSLAEEKSFKKDSAHYTQKKKNRPSDRSPTPPYDSLLDNDEDSLLSIIGDNIHKELFFARLDCQNNASHKKSTFERDSLIGNPFVSLTRTTEETPHKTITPPRPETETSSGNTLNVPTQTKKGIRKRRTPSPSEKKGSYGTASSHKKREKASKKRIPPVEMNSLSGNVFAERNGKKDEATPNVLSFKPHDEDSFPSISGDYTKELVCAHVDMSLNETPLKRPIPSSENKSFSENTLTAPTDRKRKKSGPDPKTDTPPPEKKSSSGNNLTASSTRKREKAYAKTHPLPPQKESSSRNDLTANYIRIKKGKSFKKRISSVKEQSPSRNNFSKRPRKKVKSGSHGSVDDEDSLPSINGPEKYQKELFFTRLRLSMSQNETSPNPLPISSFEKESPTGNFCADIMRKKKKKSPNSPSIVQSHDKKISFGNFPVDPMGKKNRTSMKTWISPVEDKRTSANESSIGSTPGKKKSPKRSRNPSVAKKSGSRNAPAGSSRRKDGKDPNLLPVSAASIKQDSDEMYSTAKEERNGLPPEERERRIKASPYFVAGKPNQTHYVHAITKGTKDEGEIKQYKNSVRRSSSKIISEDYGMCMESPAPRVDTTEIMKTVQKKRRVDDDSDKDLHYGRTVVPYDAQKQKLQDLTIKIKKESSRRSKAAAAASANAKERKDHECSFGKAGFSQNCKFIPENKNIYKYFRYDKRHEGYDSQNIDGKSYDRKSGPGISTTGKASTKKLCAGKSRGQKSSAENIPITKERPNSKEIARYVHSVSKASKASKVSKACTSTSSSVRVRKEGVRKEKKKWHDSERPEGRDKKQKRNERRNGNESDGEYLPSWKSRAVKGILPKEKNTVNDRQAKLAASIKINKHLKKLNKESKRENWKKT